MQNVSRAIKSGVFTSMAMIGFRSEISASQHAEGKWRKFIVCSCRNKVQTHSFETDSCAAAASFAGVGSFHTNHNLAVIQVSSNLC
jgi:hypothetical protein